MRQAGNRICIAQQQTAQHSKRSAHLPELEAELLHELGFEQLADKRQPKRLQWGWEIILIGEIQGHREGYARLRLGVDHLRPASQTLSNRQKVPGRKHSGPDQPSLTMQQQLQATHRTSSCTTASGKLKGSGLRSNIDLGLLLPSTAGMEARYFLTMSSNSSA
jgi:hypothetical protein